VNQLFVVENPQRWPLAVPGVDVVAARDYLTDPAFARGPFKVVNLCRRLGSQTTGYYVSLLAAARGHRPLPSVATIQDLRLARVVADDLDAEIQRALAPLKSDAFTISIYFGRNLAQRYARIAKRLFDQFRAPLLRAQFARDGAWSLKSLRVIAAGDIPEPHRDFVVESAQKFFARPPAAKRRKTYRYDLAILADPEEEAAPSDERALRRMVKAARERGLDARLVGAADYGRLSQFDALFLRETTAVEHHTYRFARRAAAEGLVVIDDPESILRCSNKVFQAELFHQRRIPTPRTMVVHEGNVGDVAETVGLPCVLKRPDAAFSKGVVKAADETELRAHLARFLEDSELAIAQEFVTSDYDWRVGVLGGEVLYACRYHFVRGHWQIAKEGRFGRVEAVPLEKAPQKCLRLARRAARLIGDGLYGVDLKESFGRFFVVEVNDNPNLDAGCEDAHADVYGAIADWFLARLDGRGA